VLKETAFDMYTNYGSNIHTKQIIIDQLLPGNASNPVLGWKSDKPEYITVDQNGLVTVQVSELPNNLTYETVVITCSALDGSGVTAKCVITLKQHATEVFIIDYEQFFHISNGIITGLTDYAHDKLSAPNISLNIPSIIGGETIIEIADGVFKDCENLIAITIPATVLYIGDNTFENCNNLADIHIMSNRNKVSGVPWGATNATIHWLNGTDNMNSAIELTITSSNRNLVGYTGATNETLTIPEYFYDSNGNYYRVVAIGDSAFAGCTKLSGIVLPESVTTIGANAFSGCTSLTSINLEKIKNVGDYAFKGCSAFTTISFSDNIQTIAANAFSGCSSLNTINIDRYNNEVLNGPWGATNATVVWKTSV
jgi:hypothetical protein